MFWENFMIWLEKSMQRPLTPKSKWPAIFCRTWSNLRNATSFVIRSNTPTWSPTCSYASNLWSPVPKLLYGTNLPGAVNKGLRAILTLYRHFLQSGFKRKSKRISSDLALPMLSKSKTGPLGISLLINANLTI